VSTRRNLVRRPHPFLALVLQQAFVRRSSPLRETRTEGSPGAEGGALLQVVYRRCCGLDVHQKTVVACVLLTEQEGVVRKQVRTCGNHDGRSAGAE
jgi:hypothetical protein